MKRRMVNAVLMTVLAASMVMCGCGNKAQEAPKAAKEARAAEPEEKPVSQLSGGMKRRVAI